MRVRAFVEFIGAALCLLAFLAVFYFACRRPILGSTLFPSSLIALTADGILSSARSRQFRGSIIHGEKLIGGRDPFSFA
jgi:hypothetical protein